LAAYARLLQLEAGICEKTGMQSDAEEKYRRALIMLLESFGMGEKITKDDRKLLSELVPKVRTEELPDNYGRILEDV